VSGVLGGFERGLEQLFDPPGLMNPGTALPKS